jgi:metal-responsive CopG/Arc/MetJ family transcriptional regulator
MSTQNILIRLPEELATRLKAVVPSRKRNKFVSDLVANAVHNYDAKLAEIATAVTNEEMQNSALREEMKDWEATLSDGLEEEK